MPKSRSEAMNDELLTTTDTARSAPAVKPELTFQFTSLMIRMLPDRERKFVGYAIVAHCLWRDFKEIILHPFFDHHRSNLLVKMHYSLSSLMRGYATLPQERELGFASMSVCIISRIAGTRAAMMRLPPLTCSLPHPLAKVVPPWNT